MNKAFRRSLLSLTAASAMASSAFAGNAAYVDVKVNYLNSGLTDGKETVILGIQDDGKAGKQRDRVEVLVTLLDKDGDFATKDENGKTLANIILKRGDTKLAVNGDINQVGSVANISNTGAFTGGNQHKLDRALEENKNITRFVLDYTNFTASKLEDTVTVSAGGLSQDVTIMLSSVDAEGLIVRVTNRDTFQNIDDPDALNTLKVEGANANNHDNYLNAPFSDISITDDSKLDRQSENFPTAVAGGMIPIRVYASTFAPDDADEATNGKFTLAPNLEGKTIIVQAVADYKVNGIASVVLNSTELIMMNGVASGEIEMKYGLPGSNTNTAEGVVPNTKFINGDIQGTGLGIAFVAYVKDDTDIANLDGIDLDNTATLKIEGDNKDTDTLIVRSGDPSALKVGHIYAAASKASDLWKNTSTNFYLMDAIGTDGNAIAGYSNEISGAYEGTITLTAIDMYDNPAFTSTDASEQYIRFEGHDDKDRRSDRSKITSPKGTFGNVLNFKGGNSISDEDGGAAFAISNTVKITVKDFSKKNGSASETLLINFADASLSATETIKVKIHTVETLKSTVSGNPVLADLINVSTTTTNDDDTKIYSHVTGGLEPLGGVGTEREAKFIYPEFKAKLKVTKVKDTDMTLQISMSDPEDSSDFVTNKYFMGYYGGNVESLRYRTDGESDATAATTLKTANNTKTDAATNPVQASGNTFEFTIASDSQAGLVLFRNSATDPKEVAALTFKAFTKDGIENLKGNSINITFKAYDSKKPPVYVEPYFETEEEPTGTDDGLPVGAVLKFKFSGEAVEGDEVTIAFSPKVEDRHNAYVLLEGEEFDMNARSNEIKATLDSDRMVSVVLYDSYALKTTPNDLDTGIDATDATTSTKDGIAQYLVNDIKLNGLPVIYKTQSNDKDTKEKYEVGLQTLFTESIHIKALETDGAAKIRLRFETSVDNEDIVLTHGGKDGSEDKKIADLPVSVVNDIASFGDQTKPIATDEEVQTNLYYGFFSDDKMAEVLDKYNNFVNTEEKTMEDNFIIECSSGMTCNMESKAASDNTESYIYFKAEAAGTTQTITFKVKDNEKITNTISFDNIRGNSQNTKFNITRDIGHDTFNVVNTETVIKIVGDGGKPQEETKLVAVSDNKDAKVKLIPLAVTSKFFRSIINSQGEAEETINALGNYYILTSDKPGKVTITASGTIKKGDSNTKDEVSLSGSGVVNFVAVDLDKPVVSKENVKISSGGLIVTITDANLDIEKTVVEIKGINDDGKQIAKYSGNNTYTATKLPIAVYQIVIKAYDLAGNFQEFEYVRQVKEGVAAQSPAEEVAKVLDGKEYSVDGTFEPYDFGGDKHLNWAYHESATDKWYQLLGDKQADKNANPFGWKMVEIDPNNKDADKWYMVKLTGAPGQPDEAGKFGWAMVKSDLSVVKKIAAVKANGSFEYVNVEITAKMAKDKIVFSLAKASK